MEISFRPLAAEDYREIIRHLNDWWGGRHMTDMLPRLFFQHFSASSFVAVREDQIVGFLIGFDSQTHLKEAYVHFIGTHPKFRKQKIAEKLYHLFFEGAAARGKEWVSCVTSPTNTSSIAFHQRIGFQVMEGDSRSPENVSYFRDYDGEGQDRVVFKKSLKDWQISDHLPAGL